MCYLIFFVWLLASIASTGFGLQLYHANHPVPTYYWETVKSAPDINFVGLFVAIPLSFIAVFLMGKWLTVKAVRHVKQGKLRSLDVPFAGYSVAEKGVRVVSMCYLALVSNISALWLSLIFIIISAIAVFLFDRSCSWSKADRMYLYKRRCEEEGVPVGKGPVTYFRWGIPVMIHQAIVLINFLPQIIEMLK